MCQNLTPLAVSSEVRGIYRCEHGTIHLTWEVITTYLDWQTLAHLVEVTRQGKGLEAPGQLRAGPCQLFYTRQGFFQVWVRTVGFTLSRPDFEILADMVQVAFKELTQPAAQAQPVQNTKVYQRTVKASARLSFSDN
ncbi:MAG TPA: hypothetical protein PKE64_21965 [Anaerolineae bacterium]|nr:hypothetical protein [Anaerolineae bacterium]HMR66688.1 hypothetical protein [Anaerolineae bacterium]